MSHSYGAVRLSDGTIYHTEYNGTVDVMLSNLYNTIEETSENWRKQVWKNCTCNSEEFHVECEIASTYGYGYSWRGKVCTKCKVICDRHKPDYETEIDGLPFWYPDREKCMKYYKVDNRKPGT